MVARQAQAAIYHAYGALLSSKRRGKRINNAGGPAALPPEVVRTAWPHRNQWPYSSGKYCPQLRVSYRELRGDRRLALVALRRAVEVAGAFRLGFLAAVFLVALRVAGFVFAFVDPLVVELFFFGAAADFAFRVGVLARFLVALMAAPESAPITVPTTGTPSAVPATAPAAAPPRVLPAVLMPVSVAA